MAASNATNAELFRLCFFADVYYESQSNRPNKEGTPIVFEVPHDHDSRFVLTIETTAEIRSPDSYTAFCEHSECVDDKVNAAALAGCLDVAFVLTERAPTEVTTDGINLQPLAHSHYSGSQDGMLVDLRYAKPADNVHNLLLGKGDSKLVSGNGDLAPSTVIPQVRTKLLDLLHQVVGFIDVKALERDLSDCLMPLTYEMYREALVGAIVRLRNLSLDHDNQRRRARDESSM